MANAGKKLAAKAAFALAKNENRGGLTKTEINAIAQEATIQAARVSAQLRKARGRKKKK